MTAESPPPTNSTATIAASSLVAAAALITLAAVFTAVGQRAEDALLGGFVDAAWVSKLPRSLGPPPLRYDWLTLALGVAVTALLGIRARRPRATAAAIGIVAVSLATVEAIAHLLPRPDLYAPEFGSTGNTLPSGHVAITTSLVLAAAVVVPARARPWLIALGVGWVAFTTAAVMSMLWHRPSDVLVAISVCCASALLIVQPTIDVRRSSARSVDVRRLAELSAPAMVIALVVSVRTDSLGTTAAIFATTVVGLAVVAATLTAITRPSR